MFEQFWQALPKVMAWLRGETPKISATSISTGKQVVDEVWRPPAMAQAWHMGVPLERIRFAAVNRLCVNLRYKNKVRLIEPYSVRRP
jgi:hypothetical protein